MKHYISLNSFVKLKKTEDEELYPLKPSLMKRPVFPHIYRIHCSKDGKTIQIHYILKYWISSAGRQGGVIGSSGRKNKTKNWKWTTVLSFGPVMPESPVESKNTEWVTYWEGWMCRRKEYWTVYGMFTCQIFQSGTTYFCFQLQNWIFVPWGLSVERKVSVHQSLIKCSQFNEKYLKKNLWQYLFLVIMALPVWVKLCVVLWFGVCKTKCTEVNLMLQQL